MAGDSLARARAALAGGHAAEAIDIAWKAVRPAVIAQQTQVLRDTMQFAEVVATQTDGETQREAEQLVAYCSACILQPRDTIPSAWSMKRLLSFGGDLKGPAGNDRSRRE